MSGTAADPRLAPRPAPRRRMRLSWSDPTLRALVYQVLIVGAVVALIWYLASNTNRNLKIRHIATGLGFLHQAAPIPIGETLLPYEASVDTYGRALLIGILNTLKVSIIGIVLATILGTLIGIGRLSANWLVAKLTTLYVEVLRDTPLLLQLFVWYGLVQSFPSPRGALHIRPDAWTGPWAWLLPVVSPFEGVFLSNRGIKVPWLEWDASEWGGLAGLGVGIVASILLGRLADRRQAATGRRIPVWPAAVALCLGLMLAGWAALGREFHLSVPELRGFNFAGGATLTPEYAALLIGLVTYTASYIAEIVRSGIQAVPQGQWEAAGALGLRRGVVLRRIVLPQALRVIIPPMTSQYLNLTKNSSLAVAIGYQDIVSIAGTTLNQTGQAIEGVGIIMGVFLVISLGISLFMNWYNARIALVER